MQARNFAACGALLVTECTTAVLDVAAPDELAASGATNIPRPNARTDSQSNRFIFLRLPEWILIICHHVTGWVIAKLGQIAPGPIHPDQFVIVSQYLLGQLPTTPLSRRAPRS
jgi:hypothetical protein